MAKKKRVKKVVKKKKEMTALDWISFVLIVVGGLNWGLAVFDFNLVSWLLGTGMIAKIVYGLVGLSAIYAVLRIATHHK